MRITSVCRLFKRVRIPRATLIDSYRTITNTPTTVYADGNECNEWDSDLAIDDQPSVVLRAMLGYFGQSVNLHLLSAVEYASSGSASLETLHL